MVIDYLFVFFPMKDNLHSHDKRLLFLSPVWVCYYRPHPKDGEGNSFTLLVCPRGGGQVQPGGGQVQLPGGSGPAAGGVRSSGGGRSSCRGGQVQLPGGGGVRSGGGSASCTLLRAVCLLRSRRRTFLL